MPARPTSPRRSRSGRTPLPPGCGPRRGPRPGSMPEIACPGWPPAKHPAAGARTKPGRGPASGSGTPPRPRAQTPPCRSAHQPETASASAVRSNLRQRDIDPSAGPPRIGAALLGGGGEPVGLRCRNGNRRPSGRERCPASASGPYRAANSGGQCYALLGRTSNPQSGVQPVERCVDENVAAAAGFKWGGYTHMAETHRGDSRERIHPSRKRAGRQRM